MLKLMNAGGFNMYLLAALGLVLLWIAIRFARSADPQRLSMIRALTWALLCSTVAGFMAGFAAAALYAANGPPEERVASMLIGFAEATANLILGLGIGCITWILVAVGLRRTPGERSRPEV